MQVCQKCGEQNSDTARFCQACATPLEAAEGSALPAETRKTVTLVFCDLTGSTALGEKMDPESLRRIVSRYFNDMRQVLTRHGGTVEKFIGDAVMAAFGIPHLNEDDALRAVRAAVEMQQAMEDMNLDLELEHGVGLKARIGVNTGEVIAGNATEGHGFVSGDAVNVAARLEQSAPPGEVLIGESTYRLVRDAVRVEEVEPLEVKGKAERVPAYRLVEVVPHALGSSRRLDSAIVGRDEELARLNVSLQTAIDNGSCELVTVFGMAGAGKSRLVAEFIRSLGDRVIQLQGRALPYGEGITYWPISEAIKGYAGIKEADSSNKASERLDALLAGVDDGALVSERISAAIGITSETPDTQETFWAVRRLLEEVGKEKPVVFLLEDIHWAEPTMLDLVEYLAGFSRGVPMMLLCPSRRDLLDIRPTWGGIGSVISLEPLPNEVISSLIDNLLTEAKLPESMRRQITAAAEGNPLYVEEMLRMLIDEKIIEPDEHGAWSVTGDHESLSVPPTVNALVGARLDRLGVNEQAITQRAAVIGRMFWWGAVAELSPETLRLRVGHYLQSLIRKELVFPDESSFAGEDAFRFGHIMIRDAAYQGMPKALRADLHQQFATWLEAKAGERVREYEEILGYHYEQAFLLKQELGILDTAGEELVEKATSWLASSGNKAYARSDMPAAANLLGRAAKLLPIREPRRVELSLALADALFGIGELDEATALVEQMKKVAALLKDPGLDARVRLQASFIQSSTAPDAFREEAPSELKELIGVFEDAGDHLSLARTYYLLAHLHWVEYKLGDAERSLEKALGHIAREPGSLDEAKILSSLTTILLWGPTPVDKAIRVCEELIERSGGHRFVEAVCLARTAGLMAMQGDADGARARMVRARVILTDLGQALNLALDTQDAGLSELMLGDPVAAEREFRTGVDALAAMGEQAYLATSQSLLARALFEQGKLEEALRMTEAAERTAGDDQGMKVEWGPTRARIMARQGEIQHAVELAKEVLELASEPEDVLTRGHALEAMAAVLEVADRVEEAEAHRAEALQLYESKGISSLVARLS